jgi:hypothetical protein
MRVEHSNLSELVKLFIINLADVCNFQRRSIILLASETLLAVAGIGATWPTTSVA